MSSAAVDVTFGQPSMDAVDALDPLFSNMESDVQARVQGALYAGLLNGTNPNDLAGELADCLSPARATTIARTEMLGAYRIAALDAYRANSDVVGQWMWSASRGGACIACLEMDGEVFSLDEEMDGMTHPNCRCSPIPITSSWGDILGPLGIDASGLEDTSILDDYETGAEWFAKQDAATQIDALGSKAAYEAVQAGEVSPRDFVGVNDDEQYGKSIYTKSLKEALTPQFNPEAIEEYQQSLSELDQLLAELRAGAQSHDLGGLTADDLRAAIDDGKLERFGAPNAKTFRTTIDGQDYFVKQFSDFHSTTFGYVSAESQANAEMLADKMMQQVGLGEYRVGGLQVLEVDGNQYLVQPWQEIRTLGEIPERDYLDTHLAAVDRDRLTLFDYITGSFDRHIRQYGELADGRFVSYDYSLSFVNRGTQFPGDALVERYDRKISRAALKDLLSHQDELYQMAASSLSDEQFAALRARMDILQQFLDNGGGTYSKFEKFASTATPRDIPYAAPRTAQQDLKDAQARLEQAVRSGASRQDIKAAQWDVAKKQAAVDLENGGRGVKIVVRGADPLDTSQFDQTMQNMFGRQLTRDELGGLVGAPEGSYIEIFTTSSEDNLSFALRGPAWDPMQRTLGEPEFDALRYLERDQATGDLVMHNASFLVRADMQGGGLGARIFADEVDTLSKLDVKYIETHAVGAGPNTGLMPSSFTQGANGYYTWPRFGYNGPLPQEARNFIERAILNGEIPAEWGNFTTIRQVMEASGGPEWWKANGVPLHLRFDLSDGSYSRRTLENYLKQRGLQ